MFLARGELIAAGQFDDFDPVPGRFVLGVERVDGLAEVAAVVPGEQIDEATWGHRLSCRQQDSLNDRPSLRRVDIARGRCGFMAHGSE